MLKNHANININTIPYTPIVYFAYLIPWHLYVFRKNHALATSKRRDPKLTARVYLLRQTVIRK